MGITTTVAVKVAKDVGLQNDSTTYNGDAVFSLIVGGAGIKTAKK